MIRFHFLCKFQQLQFSTRGSVCRCKCSRLSFQFRKQIHSCHFECSVFQKISQFSHTLTLICLTVSFFFLRSFGYPHFLQWILCYISSCVVRCVQFFYFGFRIFALIWFVARVLIRQRLTNQRKHIFTHLQNMNIECILSLLFYLCFWLLVKFNLIFKLEITCRCRQTFLFFFSVPLKAIFFVRNEKYLLFDFLKTHTHTNIEVLFALFAFVVPVKWANK